MTTSSIGFYPSAIKAQIKGLGLTYRKIAKEHGCAISQISEALRSPCSKGEQAISKALNVPTHVIWPDRYNRKGEATYSRSHASYNANKAHLPSQKTQAA